MKLFTSKINLFLIFCFLLSIALANVAHAELDWRQPTGTVSGTQDGWTSSSLPNLYDGDLATNCDMDQPHQIPPSQLYAYMGITFNGEREIKGVRFLNGPSWNAIKEYKVLVLKSGGAVSNAADWIEVVPLKQAVHAHSNTWNEEIFSDGFVTTQSVRIVYTNTNWGTGSNAAWIYEIQFWAEKAVTHTITTVISSSPANAGTILPSQEVKVTHGDSQTLTFTPDPNYFIYRVLIDHNWINYTNSYTFNNVTKDHLVEIEFYQKYARFLFPQNQTYDYGIMPTTRNTQDALESYQEWKQKYVVEDGAGGFRRVLFDGEARETVSEGIGYGMLLAVNFNDPDLFYDLYKYYKLHLNDNGLMKWRIQEDGSVIDSLGHHNSATDGDEDIAFALFLADYQWVSDGYRYYTRNDINFLDEAVTLINNIFDHEVEPGTFVLKPGDVWGGSYATNPSYFAPAYYRIFKAITGNADWQKVIEKNYEILEASADSSTGLVPDWCTGSGSHPAQCSQYDPPNCVYQNDDYSFDAARVPLRVAMDYIWFGNSRAKAIAEKITGFIEGVGVNNIKEGYYLNGAPLNSNSHAVGTFVSTFGVGAMAADASHQQIVDDLYSKNVSVSGDNYFNMTLRTMGLFLQNGSFIYPKELAFSEDTSIELPGLNNASVDWGDYDNDGDPDLVMSGYLLEEGSFTEIYRNDNGSFVEINAGLENAWGGQVAWGDYDNDGDLDVLVAGRKVDSEGEHLGDVSKIYRNDAGAFTDINAGLVSDGNIASALWGDYDNDGDLDVLLLERGGILRIYNNEYGVFVDSQITIADMPEDSSPSHRMVSWGDYDNDGDLDIFVSGSAIFRNDNGSYVNIEANLVSGRRGGGEWGDYDSDGDLDIIATTYVSKEELNINIYRNDSGTFVDINANLLHVSGGDVAWADYDNDGDLDVIVSGDRGIYNPDSYTKLYKNNNGTFVDEGSNFIGQAINDIAWADYDNDGDLDFIISGFSYYGDLFKTKVYRNNTMKQNTPPEEPQNLAAQVDDSQVTLEWAQSSDEETPVEGLSYEVTIYQEESVSSAKTLKRSVRLQSAPSLTNKIVLKTVQHSLTSWTFSNLLPGSYNWNVRSVDSGLMTSTLSAQGTFAVPTIGSLLVSNLTPTVSSSGGVLNLDISNSDAGDMEWSVVSNDDWITIEEPLSGINNATLNISVLSNTELSSKTGTITVSAPMAENGSQIVTVTQQGVPPPANVGPTINITSPSQNNKNADESFLIEWEATDIDDVANIDIYFDTDDVGYDGVRVAGNLQEGTDVFFNWTTSSLAQGDYYIYAVIDDGSNAAVSVYGSVPVTVTHAPPVVVLPVISATAQPGGSISPSGQITIDLEGSDQSFSIAPNAGYRVKDVLVDGVSMGAVTQYTFTDVAIDHTIVVQFENIPAQAGFPHNLVYPYGIMPQNRDSIDAISAYTEWKNLFVSTDNAQGYRRVINTGQWVTDHKDKTFSEGIGYGMLLAVNYNDQSLFDDLLQYSRIYRNQNGLMSWLIDADGTVDEEKGHQNSAIDGDEDIAFALILADSQWGSSEGIDYKSEAITLINKIFEHGVEKDTYVLKPGDNWGGSDVTNPSYFAPAYYRAFMLITGNPEWLEVIEKSYEILEKFSGFETGLIPEWCTASGQATVCNEYDPDCGHKDSLYYSYNATRVPFRIAMDYVWYGEPRAKDLLTKVTSFVRDDVGIENVDSGYNLDGTELDNDPNQTIHNNAFVSPFAVGCMGTDSSYQSTCDEFYAHNVGLKDQEYYNNSLRTLSLFLLTGNMLYPELAENVLVVDQSSLNVTYEEGMATIKVLNGSSGQMSWSVEVDKTWLRVEEGTGSGINEGEIKIAYDENLGEGRVAILTITSQDAARTPLQINIKQGPNLTHQEYAWIQPSGSARGALGYKADGSQDNINNIYDGNLETTVELSSPDTFVHAFTVIFDQDVPIYGMRFSNNHFEYNFIKGYRVDALNSGGEAFDYEDMVEVFPQQSIDRSDWVEADFRDSPIVTKQIYVLYNETNGGWNAPVGEIEFLVKSILTVSDQQMDVSYEAGSHEIKVSNLGTGVIDWMAQLEQAHPWINIASGDEGSNSGVVTFEVERNLGDARTANIQIMTDAALNAPLDIEITQEEYKLFDEVQDVSFPMIGDRSLDWGDYDNDGDLDVVIISNSEDSAMYVAKVYKNHGSNNFVEQDIALDIDSSRVIQWLDYDQDGDLDIYSSSKQVYLNNGNNNFSEASLQFSPNFGSDIVQWGDYDQDGDLDILCRYGVASKIYQNNGDHTFNEANMFYCQNNWCLSESWVDYDNDGDLDVFLSSSDSYEMYQNNGEGSFSNQEGLFSPDTHGYALFRDFNNDGYVDMFQLIKEDEKYYFEVYRNNNGNSFIHQAKIDFASVFEQDILGSLGYTPTIGDFNNDGHLDVVFIPNGSATFFNNILSIMYAGDGNFGFVKQSYVSMTSQSPIYVKPVDYDSDGDLDIFLKGAYSSDTPMKIFINNIEETKMNSQPSSPSGLHAEVRGQSVTFSWDKASDQETSSGGLTYNIYVYEEGSANVVSSTSDSNTGFRKVSKEGNVGHATSWTVHGLTPSAKYYWSVQAIDTSFVGSSFPEEQSFIAEDLAELFVGIESTSMPWTQGSIVLDIKNVGTGDMPWTVEIVEGGDWLTVEGESSGVNDQVVQLNHAVSLLSLSRIAKIRVDASGAEESPIEITIFQNGTEAGKPYFHIYSPVSFSSKADESFQVRWTEGSYGDAKISLYYDTNDSGQDGVEIVKDLKANEGDDFYLWDTSLIPDGEYYVYGILEDGYYPEVVSYSPGFLTVKHPKPILDVSPINQSVLAEEDTLFFDVNNAGDSDLFYTATVTEGGSWLSILSGEESQAPDQVVVVCSLNNTMQSRKGIITISAKGADDSPQVVEIDQAGGGRIVLEGPMQILAADGLAKDLFGYSISTNGADVFIGSPRNGESCQNCGAVYVYAFDGKDWIQKQKLMPEALVERSFFGAAVDVFEDYAVIGAHGTNDYRGKIYVYKNNGLLWELEAELIPDDLQKSDLFGSSVALDGENIVVGAHGADDNGSRSGAAYFYQKDQDVWSLVNRVVASNGGSSDTFAGEVDISGEYAVIGSHLFANEQGRIGSAYVFHLVDGQWVEEAMLTSDEPQDWDYFGVDVVIIQDTIVVGSSFDDDRGLQSGSVYVFERYGQQWDITSKLVADDGHADDKFGSAIDIFENKIIVGAYLNDTQEQNSGAAYQFEFYGNVWSQTKKIIPDEGKERGFFGGSVAIFDGVSFVGEIYGDGQQERSGRVHAFPN